MIDLSFTYADLEYFLLIIVRVTCFIYIAPFFGMNNTPNRVKIALGVLISILLFGAVERPEIIYNTVMEYAVIVMKEAVTGFLIGFGAQLCTTITTFAGHMVDTEIGLAMVNIFDPSTNQNVSITGIFYQYIFLLMMIVTGMHQYLLKALADSFILIPINGAIFKTDSLVATLISFMGNYLIIGFRICLPVFCAIMLMDCILGILAKIAPQMNMFAVGIQLKILAGLGILFFSAFLLPGAADFVFQQMQHMIASFVEGMR